MRNHDPWRFTGIFSFFMPSDSQQIPRMNVDEYLGWLSLIIHWTWDMIRFEYVWISWMSCRWIHFGGLKVCQCVPVFVAGGSRCRENASRMQNWAPQVPVMWHNVAKSQWIPDLWRPQPGTSWDVAHHCPGSDKEWKSSRTGRFVPYCSNCSNTLISFHVSDIWSCFFWMCSSFLVFSQEKVASLEKDLVAGQVSVSCDGSKGHAFRTSRMAPSVFLTLTALTALTLFQEMGPPPPRPRKWCPNTPSQSDMLWAVTWAMQPCISIWWIYSKHFRSLVNFHGRWMEGADAAMEAHPCSLRCSLAPLEAFLVCQEDMADEETWATVPCYQRLSNVNSPRYNNDTWSCCLPFMVHFLCSVRLGPLLLRILTAHVIQVQIKPNMYCF